MGLGTGQAGLGGQPVVRDELDERQERLAVQPRRQAGVDGGDRAREREQDMVPDGLERPARVG
jgi:hypothetical protein